MRRTIKRCGTLALVAGVLLSTWGVGTSAAQEHDHDHDHDHGTTTSAPATTSTSAPATTSTTAPATTSTTAPATTSTTHGHEPTTSSSAPSPTTSAPTGGTPGQQSKTVRYGPFNVPAAPPNPDGSHGHAHTGNLFRFGVEKPCTNCYITGMQADLVYPDGRQAGYSTNAQLHHMVLANQSWGRTDPTCYIGFPFPLGLLFGQRFFASGDERTLIDFPEGYGYQVGAWDNWNLIYELAGMAETAQSVLIEMKFTYVPNTTPGMTNVEPVWFDVAQCGFSTIARPQGTSQASWTWNVNRPGGIMQIGGHVHDGGVNIEIRNDTTGQVICDSRAGYGESPLYIDAHGGRHISSMSKCLGRRGAPVATVSNGQRVTIRANYDMPAAVNDQMGIVMGFVAAT